MSSHSASLIWRSVSAIMGEAPSPRPDAGISTSVKATYSPTFAGYFLTPPPGLARLGSSRARGPEREAATLSEWIFHKTAHSAAYLPYFDSSGKQWGDNKDYE